MRTGCAKTPCARLAAQPLPSERLSNEVGRLRRLPLIERKRARAGSCHGDRNSSRKRCAYRSGAVPFFAVTVLMHLAHHHNHGWLAFALAFPAAGLLGRLFIIQHDCGHGSFFKSTRANDMLGAVLGVLTLTPYSYWKQTHAMHHATSGNLDKRGYGDISTLTVAEFEALSAWGQWKYRVYRSFPLEKAPPSASVGRIQTTSIIAALASTNMRLMPVLLARNPRRCTANRAWTSSPYRPFPSIWGSPAHAHPIYLLDFKSFDAD